LLPFPIKTGQLLEPFFLGPDGLRVHQLTPVPREAWAYKFQDVNAGYTNSNLAHWKAADINGDGRGDLIEPYFLGAGNGLRIHKILSNSDNTSTFSYQDVNSGYTNSNLANWKVADINGDGLNDLVEPYYLGAGFGLRIHTILAKNDGKWSFTYQDVNLGYLNSNLANWKVADINGDGRDDLVEPYFLGVGNGLRIHTVISNSDGTQKFIYQDVNSGYTNGDLTNWKVADVNGDKRDDLVEPYFLGTGFGLRIHTVLSNSNNSWNFSYRDVDSGYRNNNLANWKVADVNSDGHCDLVEPYFLGLGKGLRIHKLLSTDIGSWTYNFQDVNSGYTNSDLKNWKVMDVDGDTYMDLVEPYFLGTGNGLRIHTARSLPNGDWSFSYWDADVGYENFNLVNWKVTGLKPNATP
jgi:hypothetical protein